jgi:hypothetical protein
MAEEKVGNPNEESAEPVCPKNPRWLKSMLDQFPVGAAGKLEKFRGCIVDRTPAPVQPAEGEASSE